MKFNLIALAALAASFGACGDNGNTDIEAEETLDTGTATLRVERNDYPVAEYAVLVHDTDGRLVAESLTGIDGTVTFDVEGTAAVTVATDLGDLVTIGSIVPGDHVLWIPEQEATRELVTTVGVSSSGAANIAGANLYQVHACGGSERSAYADDELSIAVDLQCLNSAGELNLLGVALSSTDSSDELLAYTNQVRKLPITDEAIVFDLSGGWRSDWVPFDMAAEAPSWTTDGQLYAQASLIGGTIDHVLPRVSLDGAPLLFPEELPGTTRVAEASWTDVGEVYGRRSTQWLAPDSDALATSWLEPGAGLELTDFGPDLTLSWTGRLGTAVAAQLTWQTKAGTFRRWTSITRGDSRSVSMPELTDEGSFVGPSGFEDVSLVLARGLSRGTTNYAASLADGAAAHAVWPNALRRSVAIHGSAQTAEVFRQSPR